jgi:hypothetical protein
VNRLLIFVAALGTGIACSCAVEAQQSFRAHFFAHNDAMSALQPAWPTPVVETEPRLTQYYRFAFSNEYTATGTQTVNYGNARGGGIIGWNRFEFDLLPPPYVQHNSSAADGFGDTSVLVKCRIVSDNATHGNYIATAVLSHTFATGSAKNGAPTDSWNPTLAGGKGLTKRIDVESSLGGSMPTGKIAAQGRTISWNSLAQDHIAKSVWLELENNAMFFRGGGHDGMMQNFVTPGAFYVLRRSDWKPTHPFLVFDGGMQIATSRFHTYNHNLIAEMRILF